MTKLDDARVVCVAWINKDDYLAIFSAYEDNDVPLESWEEWEKRAETVEAGLRNRGFIVERMFIDPTTLAEWRQQRDARRMH